MHLLENGYSVKFIKKKYGINDSRLNRLWILYQEKGKDALARKTNIRADGALRETIVRDYLENHLSWVEISLKYNVPESRLSVLSRIVREQEYAALYAQKRLMKNESLYLQEWDNVEQFAKELETYIRYYNNDRIKLRLNGKSPVQYRALFQSKGAS